MDKSLLVAVFVPTTDETGRDFGGKRGELATGYPVGRDLILTACRILQPGPPYYRDKNHPVRVCWHSPCPEDIADWVKIPDEGIIWQGHGDLDAALIRCERPDEEMGSGIVSYDRPIDKVKWTSEGFPGASRYEDQRCTHGFSGKGLCCINRS